MSVIFLVILVAVLATTLGDTLHVENSINDVGYFKSHSLKSPEFQQNSRWRSYWSSPSTTNDDAEYEEGNILDELIDDYFLDEEPEWSDDGPTVSKLHPISKRPMGLGPYANWQKFFAKNWKQTRSGGLRDKRPIGFGPSLKWNKYWKGKRVDDEKIFDSSEEDDIMNDKRPMGIGPNLNWMRYFKGKRGDTYPNVHKRPMAASPNVNYWKSLLGYRTKGRVGKRPMGVGPYSDWSKIFG